MVEAAGAQTQPQQVRQRHPTGGLAKRSVIAALGIRNWIAL